MSNIQSFLLSCQNVTVKFIKTVHFHYLYFIWRFYIVTPISNCNGTWSTSNTQALACSDNAPRSPFDPSLSAKMKRCGAFVKTCKPVWYYYILSPLLRWDLPAAYYFLSSFRWLVMMLGDKRGPERVLTLTKYRSVINRWLWYCIHNATWTWDLSQVCNNHISAYNKFRWR